MFPSFALWLYNGKLALPATAKTAEHEEPSVFCVASPKFLAQAADEAANRPLPQKSPNTRKGHLRRYGGKQKPREL